jgi:hypothetical protein
VAFIKSLDLLPDPYAQIRAMQDKVRMGSMPVHEYKRWFEHPAFQQWCVDHASAICEWLEHRDAA